MMQAKRWWFGCVVLACLGVAVGVARSAEEEGQGADDMSPEQAKMMEAYMKAGTPGPEHARLTKLAGHWNAEVKFWYQPDSTPSVSKGTSDFKSILGGRYVEEAFKSDMGGVPFEGRGLSGYDNLKKKYVSLWMDSMSTSIMMLTGEWDEAQKAIVTYGEETDPMGTKWKLRSVAKEVSPTKYVYSAYRAAPDGKEYKSLEVTYTKGESGGAGN
ncbi:MAG TPA: DUF1579 domain-containing protein [Phycisphaerae bacterium]|nr:DUF1579 domain-containing protein [Phycisphaerae bacterium]